MVERHSEAAAALLLHRDHRLEGSGQGSCVTGGRFPVRYRSARLGEHFILHWSTVPLCVPKVDFAVRELVCTG